MKVKVITDQGKRLYMEDRHYLDLSFNNQSCVFGLICDGHEGDEAAEYTKNNLPKVIIDKLNKSNDIVRAYIYGFEEISDNLKDQESGTTAISFLIKDKELIIANAGDSRAIMIRKNSVRQLTNDHRVNNSKEAKRILALGGYISDPYAYLPDSGVGLMPTRTIGDQAFKQIGIIATPEITTYHIHEDDLALIVATDGLFDELDNEQVANIARLYLDTVGMMVEKIKQSSQSLFGGEDNVTIIAITLK